MIRKKWMINEVDKNRVRKQLLNKIKIDVDMVRRLLPKQVNLNKFLKNLEHKVIHDYKIPYSKLNISVVLGFRTSTNI